jgi:putative tricarboxylic transport membrane protein
MVFEHYLSALLLVFQPFTLVVIAMGVLLGILFGSLPGLTATMGIVIIIPLTYGLPPQIGIGALLGVYCGAISGGAIAATLLKIPGTPSSVATTFDAYPLAQRGEAGRALGIGIFTSFLGGIFSALVLSIAAPPIARFALRFGAAEYASLALFGLMIIGSISAGSMIKGIIAGAFGVFVSTIGTDPMTGTIRFTFGQPSLLGGIDLLPALIGLFAISTVFDDVQALFSDKTEKVVQKVKGAHFRVGEVFSRWRLVLVSAIIGTGVGALPGAGGSIASFLAYDTAKRMSKHPEEFGKGSVEGIIASETSNNAVTGGSMIPMITLGVPGDSATAVLMGGLLVQGLRPGPILFREQPTIAYGIFVALFVANIFMLIIQYFGIRIYARLLLIKRDILTPIILVLCMVGAYGTSGRLFDTYIVVLFGVIGYFFMKFRFGVAPVVLGIILGPILESNFRRAMHQFKGDWTVFFQRPISLVFLLAALLGALWPVIHNHLQKKNMSEGDK